MFIAALFMIAGRRPDLVETLLTGLTGASFAVALAVANSAGPSTSSETVLGIFQPSVFFAFWLLLAASLREG